jgi:glutamyl-tRNA reductase
MRAEFPTKVAEYLLKHGVKPLKIAVRTERTAQSLAPLAEELGIRIKMSPRLPALDSAMEFLGRMYR